MNYQDVAIDIFKEISDKYNLKIIKIEDDTIALIGNKFAILIFMSKREGVELHYIMENEHGEMIRYFFNNFISCKFDSNDRAVYGNPVSIDEKIAASLRVKAKGLANQWQNVLSGGKDWIDDFLNAGLGREGYSVSQRIEDILDPYFKEQTV